MSETGSPEQSALYLNRESILALAVFAQLKRVNLTYNKLGRQTMYPEVSEELYPKNKPGVYRIQPSFQSSRRLRKISIPQSPKLDSDAARKDKQMKELERKKQNGHSSLMTYYVHGKSKIIYRQKYFEMIRIFKFSKILDWGGQSF